MHDSEAHARPDPPQEESLVAGVAKRTAGLTFETLSIRNFRLFLTGQAVSITGTWIQFVGLAWFVIRLTHDPVAMGNLVALAFLPVMLLGQLGGLIADRFDKRTLLIYTQTIPGLLSVVLAVLDSSGSIRLWMVYVIVIVMGVFNAVDYPTELAFVGEMVGPEHLSNAVPLNGVVQSLSRMIGPAIAAVLIATVGIPWCFFVNGASYIAVVAAFVMMRSDELHTIPPVGRKHHQLRDALKYVVSTPRLLYPLIMLALVATFAYNFQLTLALLAKFAFRGDARHYGAMLSALSVGSLFGGLVLATRRKNLRMLTLVGIAFANAVCVLAVALAPNLAVELVVLPVMGALTVALIGRTNTMLQRNSSHEMHGRVMSFYTIAYIGTTPIGALEIGWLAHFHGPRAPLVVGAIACAVAAGVGLVVALRGDAVISGPGAPTQ